MTLPKAFKRAEATEILGGSGIEVSRIAIGCNSFGRSIDRPGVKAIVAAALENGVNFFDAADVYGNPRGRAEELLGEALGHQRQSAIVATKFGFPMSAGASEGLPTGHGTRRYVRAAADASLGRLKTDYIDLLQIHVPDPTTPVEETLLALEGLVLEGKIRAFGLSRYSCDEIIKAARLSEMLSSVQVEYSLLCHGPEDGALDCADRLGLSLLAFLPLASGLLTGKYRRHTPSPAGARLEEPAFAEWLSGVPWDKIEKIEEFSRLRALSILSVALGYILAQPSVTSAIVGVTSVDQVIENVSASAWRPDASEFLELRNLLHRWPSFDARVPWHLAAKW